MTLARLSCTGRRRCRPATNGWAAPPVSGTADRSLRGVHVNPANAATASPLVAQARRVVRAVATVIALGIAAASAVLPAGAGQQSFVPTLGRFIPRHGGRRRVGRSRPKPIFGTAES